MLEIQIDKDAFIRGYKACQVGKMLSDNPFTDLNNKKQYNSWNKGWREYFILLYNKGQICQ